ncbi:acyltransferase [Bifidobacterium sp. ESL0728]|uniref:acyltransferase n=1 Tax=Bifidobacterium sp. ESL0728 TaxID=2983220 RepID=UPI0023F6C8EA|nr:acyltransferase [Bifidobacterium sp. ESL0728]WEV58857.1 acyltransferase [Bifidobacterium sp. ESL0728]
MKRKQRIAGYDLAKALSMILVILLHLSFYTYEWPNNAAGDLLLAPDGICIPLFFAVNGALLLPRPLNMKKHVHKLVVMVVIMELWKLLVALFFVWASRPHPFTAKEFVGYMLGGTLGTNPTGHFWFINALIAVYLVYPLIKRAYDSSYGSAFKWVTVVLGLFYIIVPSLAYLLNILTVMTNHDVSSLFSGIDDYNIFGKYGYTLFYFMVGGMFSNQSTKQKLEHVKGRMGNRLIVPVAVVTLLVCFGLDYGINRFGRSVKGTQYEALGYPNGYLMLTTCIAALLVFALLLPVQVPHWSQRLVTILGSSTFGVYMLHVPILVIIGKLQHHGFMMGNVLPGWLMPFWNVVLVLLIYVVCVFVSHWGAKIPVVGRLFTFK